ncbi:hypothetical protein GWK47_040316 [Chionoecetes opilio]|uniref:Uncharacterized protein n=1 Tax=Chionoecetes opilio TaxID=41210 RepID=A0A8J4YAV0_CHIOP|nr:hypothetical protein GWK47_040316 [Chionoecetes opilio]
MTKKIYNTCQQFLEEGRLENERRFKRTKILTVELGDRVYLKNIPKVGEPKKLQPFYEGPYRVMDKIGDVVLKVKRIRGGKTKIIHTDNVKVVPEGALTTANVRNIRQAFPWDEQGESSRDIEDEMDVRRNGRFPTYRETLEEMYGESGGQSPSDGVDEEAPTRPASPQAAGHSPRHSLDSAHGEAEIILPPRRVLRSNSSVPELPFIMSKPIEHRGRGK